MKNALSITMLFLIITFGSCTKVINVNLNSSSPRYVITGNVTNQPGPYIVNITKSINFDQDNNFPAVSGALVYITDSNINHTDTLAEIKPGDYQVYSTGGIPGHTYNLTIISGSDHFTSSSTMPLPVLLDSVYTVPSLFGSGVNVVPLYKDPVGIGNYYHLLLTIKDSVSQNIYIHSDQITDGQEVSQTLRNDIDVSSGDPITVELQCIDHGVFQYYQDLSQTIQQNSATPANPQSNITGGALGYFSAHTVNRKIITAP